MRTLGCSRHTLPFFARGREVVSLGRFGGVIGEERAKHSGRFSLSLGAKGLLSFDDVLFMLDAADFCTHSLLGWKNSQVCCVRVVQVDG